MKKFFKIMQLHLKCDIVIVIILRKAGDEMTDRIEDLEKNLESTGSSLIHEDIVKDVKSRMHSEEYLVEVA